MKKFPKAGLLIITLVIPALIFVLLKLFATNHYDLPYFNPKLGADQNVEIVNGDTVFQKISEIRLSTVNVKLEDQLSVISVMQEDCGETCKLVLSNLQRIYDLRSGIEKLNIVTLSKDSLSASTEFRDLGNPGWNVVTTKDANIADVLNSQSAAFKKMLELYSNGSGLMLVDRRGYTRGYYNGADPEEVDRLMAEIKILNYEDKASANP